MASDGGWSTLARAATVALAQAAATGVLPRDPADTEPARRQRVQALHGHDWEGVRDTAWRADDGDGLREEEAQAFMRRVATLEIECCAHCKLGRWRVVERR